MNPSRTLLVALVCLLPAVTSAEEHATEPSIWERRSIRLGLGVCPLAISGLELQASDPDVGQPHRTGLLLNPEISGHLQVGAQFGELVAIYYQLGIAWGVSLLGFAVGNYSFGVWSNAAVFEVTVFRVLQLAVGPSLIVGMAFDSPNRWDPTFSWPNPVGGGGMARLNVVVPPRRAHRRWGIAIGFQGQFAWFDGGEYWNVALVLGMEGFSNRH